MASYIEQAAQGATTPEAQDKLLKVLDHAYVRTTLFFAARSQNKNASEDEILSQAEELRQGILDNECQNYFHFALTCMKGERVDCAPFFEPLLDCAAGRLSEE